MADERKISLELLNELQSYPISYQLKRIRCYCGYSQKQAAELLGCKQPTISSWEAGKSKPYGRLRERLIELYGLPFYYFSGTEIEHVKFDKKNKKGKD